MSAPITPITYLPIRQKLLGSVPLLVSHGSTRAEIARVLQITPDELRRRLVPGADDALADAWQEGLDDLESRLVKVCLDEAECGKHRLAAAKYLLDSKFGYSVKDPAPATAVQINFTMPVPEQLSTFLERTRALASGDDDE